MSESIYTRADLIEDVATNTSIDKAHSKAAVKAVISAVIAAVQRGQKVAIKEFLTMEAKPTKAKAAYTGRNPRTGSPLRIDAKPAGKRVAVHAKFPAE
jgi:DNA-binding protein HU-beta